MGKTITLYCEETPQLKLGPGVLATVRTTQAAGESEPLKGGRDVIPFSSGFATFDEADFPLWRQWKDAPGTPFIRIVDEDAGEATEITAESVTCPVCGRELKNAFALNGHLRSHSGVAGKVTNN